MSRGGIIVPFVSRARTEDSDDGFEICERGSVLFDGSSLSIFEDSEPCKRNPVAVVDISSLHHVKCRKFQSASGNHCGGRVELHGTEERLILKMELPEYFRFKTALTQAMNS
mmetsp:Transcript_30681/g.51018  ORF Transcript_30681/g.51018 Transcript_30681/m.51018 type:complete len:112 (-) Transcript_30681:223-558(-)